MRAHAKTGSKEIVSTKAFGDTTHLQDLFADQRRRRRWRGTQVNEDSCCGGGVTVHERRIRRGRGRAALHINPSVRFWGHPHSPAFGPLSMGDLQAHLDAYGLSWQTWASLALEIHALRLPGWVVLPPSPNIKSTFVIAKSMFYKKACQVHVVELIANASILSIYKKACQVHVVILVVANSFAINSKKHALLVRHTCVLPITKPN